MRILVAGAMAGMVVLALVLGGCGDDDDGEDGGGDGLTPSGQPTLAPTQPGGAPTAPVDGGTPSSGNAPGIPPLQGEIVVTESGLRYIDEVVGPGPAPASANTCVTVHYTGWLTDGTEFDSSVGGAPVPLPLSGVIEGWTEGVGSMNEGGKRRLIIPSDLGYGPGGNPPVIPPNAELIFDVELITVGGEAVLIGGRPTCPA